MKRDSAMRADFLLAYLLFYLSHKVAIGCLGCPLTKASDVRDTCRSDELRTCMVPSVRLLI